MTKFDSKLKEYIELWYKKRLVLAKDDYEMLKKFAYEAAYK